MVTIRKRWRLRALMGLIVLAALVMAFVRDRLKYDDPPGRMTAAVRMGMLGPTKGKFAEPALLAALNDPDQGVCDCAAWALDRIGSTSPALVEALVKQVEVETSESLRWRWEGDFYRRVEPSKALERIKPTASTLAPLLGKAMSSPDPFIRSRAANLLRDAIRRSGGATPDVSPLLLATLRGAEPGLRFDFFDDLANSDDETRRAAVAILLQRLRNPAPPDVFEAAVALARFGPEAGAGRQGPRRSAAKGRPGGPPRDALLAEQTRSRGEARRAGDPAGHDGERRRTEQAGFPEPFLAATFGLEAQQRGLFQPRGSGACIRIPARV